MSVDLMLEILKDIQARLGLLVEGQQRIEVRLTALEQHFATSLALAASDRDEIDKLKHRIERLERRLNLVD